MKYVLTSLRTVAATVMRTTSDWTAFYVVRMTFTRSAHDGDRIAPPIAWNIAIISLDCTMPTHRRILLAVFVALANVARCSPTNECSLTNELRASWFKDVDSTPLELRLEGGRIELSDEVFRGKIQLFEDAFELSIKDQRITRLCEGSVRITNDLTLFKLINCSLSALDPGAFDVVPTLALLKISHNPITTIRGGVFNTVKVKELDLTHNFISSIEDDAFDNNTNLEVVRLSHNSLKEISPDWFRRSPKVFKLNVIYNELTKLPARAFGNMARDRSLKLRFSANQIEEIDERAFEGTVDIDMLRLNGNKIRELPGSLFANRTFKNLQVNTNKLRCFPDLLFDSGLKTLAFIENMTFNCTCLNKVREFVEKKNVDVWYPSIICEDRTKELNIVYNYNKTYEIPVLMPSTEVALLLPFNGAT